MQRSTRSPKRSSAAEKSDAFHGFQLWGSCGFLWKIPHRYGAILLFCSFSDLSTVSIPLSTEVFKQLWITIFCYPHRWKVSKAVFHKLLKTYVDIGLCLLFSGIFVHFFTEIRRNRGNLFFRFRKIHTKFTVSEKMPPPLENSCETAVFSTKKRSLLFGNNPSREDKSLFSTILPERNRPLENVLENKKFPHTREMHPNVHKFNDSEPECTHLSDPESL